MWMSFVATPFWKVGFAGTRGSKGREVMPNESEYSIWDSDRLCNRFLKLYLKKKL